MKLARLAGLGVAFGLIGLMGRDVSATNAVPRPQAFSEIAWPLLRDQWGRGRAFTCDASRCGAQLKLYVRSKVGFCECFDHVDDDDDVDRLTDFDLIGGDRIVALGAGRRIAVNGNPARLRAFRLESPKGPARQALALAVASDCRALVALLVADREVAPDTRAPIETAVLQLITDLLPGAPAANDRSELSQ